MELGKMFQFKKERYASRTAIVQGDTRLTYAELYKYSNRIANGLYSIGVRTGDRVLTALTNRLETVALYWGVQLVGAVFTPVNFRFTAFEMNYVLDNSGAVAVAFEKISANAVKASTANRNVKLIGVGVEDKTDLNISNLDDVSDEHYKRKELSVYEPALMLYTSGTTGRPKGVPRSHLNEYSASVAHIIQNNYVEYESTISVMPLYHTMGMRSMISMLMLGGKLVMVPDYNPETLLNAIQTEKVSCLYLIPTMYHDIFYSGKFEKYDVSSVNKIGYAGAAMTKLLTKLCFEKFKPKVFVNHFGSTEVYTYTICNYLDRKPTCAGKAGFHERVKIVKFDDDNLATPDDVVKENEVGQVIIDTSSDESFRGYWNNSEATKFAIRDGWFFTKDIGYMDNDGDIFVLGRLDDMIISGGENIHPLEVEDALEKHPAVKEVAVIGLPDNRWGHIVTAVVVKNSEVTPEELDRFFIETSNLARFKRPRKYIFVDSLIKSSTGKILRQKIREQFESKTEAN